MKTVKDLIEELQKCDPNMPVMLNGYEGGLNSVRYTEVVKVTLNCNTEWYYGRHERSSEGNVTAIVIN